MKINCSVKTTSIIEIVVKTVIGLKEKQSGLSDEKLTEKSLKCSENRKREKEDEKNEILRCR